MRVEEQLGLQEVGLNDPVTPVGKPEADSETDWVVPETKLTPIELFTADPLATVLSGGLLRLKSKAVMVMEQVAVT